MESIGGGFGSGHPTNTDPGIPQDLIRKYAIYDILGVQFEQDSNIVVDASDDAVGGLFARESLRLVDFTAPSTYKEEDYDTGTWTFYGDQDFGHGVFYTGWLTKLYSDALAPTA